MQRIIGWVKGNLLVFGLIVVVAFLILERFAGVRTNMVGNYSAGMAQQEALPMMAKASDSYGIRNSVAPSESANRMVVTTTSLSMQVADVPSVVEKIQVSVEAMGGFLVNSNLSKPEGAASGSITVRVPTTKIKEALTAIKAYGVKVVSENVNGTDVTDQYEDLEARLEVLNATKVKFEDIMKEATQIQDLLNVQQQIISLQSQIDSVKGQQKYLSQTAKLSLVSVYLSTDDLALPYTPDNSWRPAVVFKEAVRSLVINLRGLGSLAIWLVVYSPIWVGGLVVVWFVKRRYGR